MPRIKRYLYDGQARMAFDAWKRDAPEIISCDCESSGFAWNDLPFGVTIAWKGEQHYIELGDFVRECTIATILASTPVLVFHNAKFDMRMLCAAGVLVRKRLTADSFHDTETLAHILDENRLKGLKSLAQTVLGRTTDEAEVLKAVRRELKLKKDDGFEKLPRPVLVPYAIQDARLTFDLFQALDPQIQARPGLLPLYDQERALTLALLDMEFAGLATRLDYVEEAVKDFGLQVLKLERSICDLVGRDDFNPNSPKQILDAFADRGIELEGTAVAILETVNDPLARELLAHRKVTKLRSTYLVPMQHEVVDGVLHASLRQHGTKTGRLSSGEATNN